MMEEPLDLKTEIAFMSREERKEENKSEGEKAMNLFSPGREQKKTEKTKGRFAHHIHVSSLLNFLGRG